MREVAGGGIAAVSIPLAPVVAQRFAFPIAVTTFLPLTFAFTFSFPDLAL